jgi:hypothetical protein
MNVAWEIAGYLANKYDAGLQAEELQEFASVMQLLENIRMW